MDQIPQIPQAKPEQKEKIKLHILYAEDNETLAQVANIFLKGRYDSVEYVKDGEELLKKLQTPGASYDVVLTDNQMPKVSGLEALKVIRGLGGDLAAIPVVMVSTDTGSIEKNVQELGGYFIPKPFVFSDLYKVLDALAPK